MAREGAIVIVHGRSKTSTEEDAHDIVIQGGRAYSVFGDLTNDDDVQGLVNDAQAFVKPVEILINNAGGSGEPEDWTTTRPETWASGYDRNVLAAVRVTARLLPNMRAAKWGRIVNISSMAAMMPPAKRPEYGAAKAAMIAMTASLAKEVAMDAITATTVSPGTIHSDKLDEGFRKVAAGQGLASHASWTEIEKRCCRCLLKYPWEGWGRLRKLPMPSCSS